MERKRWEDLTQRPLIFPTLGFGLGIGFPGHRLFLVGAFALSVAALALRKRPGGHLILLTAFVCAGMGEAAFEAETSLPPASVLSMSAGWLEATVQDASVSSFGQTVWMKVDGIRTSANSPRIPYRFGVLAFSSDRRPLLTDGARIIVPLKSALVPLEGPSNPGEPDWSQASRRRGIVFRARFDAQRVIHVARPSQLGARLQRAREAVGNTAKAWAPSPDAAAIYATLAAGLRSELSPELEDAYARSGLAHLLSVSGLHVAALALMILGATRWGMVRLFRTRTGDRRRLSAALSIPWLWAYVAFTGFQPPAVRSGVIATVMLLAMALWRSADLLNALSLAALLMWMGDPGSIAEISLQLSFLAVLALTLLSPALRELIPLPKPDPSIPGKWSYRWQRMRETLVQTSCASLAVTLATFPWVATQFHRVSIAGLISNLLILPLSGVLTALTAGGAALHLAWPPLAVPLILGGSYLCAAVTGLAQTFARMPGGSWETASIHGGWMVLYMAGLATFALGVSWWRAGAVLTPLAVFAAVVVPLFWSPHSHGTSVTFLSVGQGDAIVISSHGQHALIDGGGMPQGADPGERVVLPFLREAGISSLALAALSHPHPDHALGLKAVLSAIKPRRLWFPAGNEHGALSQAVEAAAGIVPERVDARAAPFQLGEMTLEVLGPPEDRTLLESVNDRSLVIRARHGDVTFLLTGDIEEAAEETLSAGRVTVLKAPHHGSRTSSSPLWLDGVKPRFVVFCVGRQNRFGFPHAEVLARYQAAGTQCFRTDIQGAVRFDSDGQDVRWTTYLPSPPSCSPAISGTTSTE